MDPPHDYSAMTGWSDFIKPVLYSHCAGRRLQQFIESTHENIFGDLTNQQALDIQYRALNYEESPWGRVAGTALRELGLL